MTDRVHVAVALDGAGWHPAAWREETAHPTELANPRYWVDLVRSADVAGAVFVTIEDALTLGGRTFEPDAESRRDRVRGRLDAVLLANYLAPLTRRIGLLPTVTTTHPEPFHLATGLQTLDYTSHGRAGYRVVAGSTPAERANFGRRSEGPLGLPSPGEVQDVAWAAALREAGDVVEVIRRLADSWEDDAIIRDLATGRYIDRDRIHNIEFEGEFFSVKGASIVPRSPQGQPVITALAHQTAAYAFAAEHADVVFITPAEAPATNAILEEIATLSAGRRAISEPLKVFADLLVVIEDNADAARQAWARLEGHERLHTDARVVVGTPVDVVAEIRALGQAGVDGVRLRPGRLPTDLAAITRSVLPRLAADGVLAVGTGVLRERLGLPRLASRFARTEVSK